MKDNPTPPEKSASLEQLVELMSENNRATSEIERDGRNTRRHLLEMKKIQQASLDMSDRVNVGFDNFFETMNANKLGEKENARERSSIFEEIRDELKEMRSSGIPQNGGSGGSSAGGMMGGLGKMLGGAGIGVGAAAVGVAAVFASSAFLIDTIENMDGKKIVQNVDDLLGISKLDADEGAAAKVFGTLTAIGAGLMVFSAGSATAALSQAAIDKFEANGWAEQIKNNVSELLSIADLPGMSAGNVTGVAATMAALGIGLLAFSAGSATGAAVKGMDEAIDHFSGGDGFASHVKKNVETLLSIDTTSASGVGSIVGTMSALSLGLLAFSVGSATSAAVSGVDAAIEKFSGKGWAEHVVHNVETLLGLSKQSFGDVAEVTAALTLLGGGLLAFSIGGGTNAALAGADKGLEVFTDTGWAEQVVKNVKTLTAIGAEEDGLAKSAKAAGSLTLLAGGLAAFAGGTFFASLAKAGDGLVNFFVGGDSPIESALKVGEKAGEIDKGTEAFGRFADVLERFNTIAKVEFNAEKFATDLTAAAKTLELVVNGGTSDSWMPFDEVTYVGLKNMNGDINAAVDSITKLQGSFNMSSGGTDVSASSQSMGVELMNVSAQNVELRNSASAAAPVVNSVANNSSNVQGGNTYNMMAQKPNKTRESVASR
jgi:hypothetical protein